MGEVANARRILLILAEFPQSCCGWFGQSRSLWGTELYSKYKEQGTGLLETRVFLPVLLQEPCRAPVISGHSTGTP